MNTVLHTRGESQCRVCSTPCFPRDYKVNSTLVLKAHSIDYPDDLMIFVCLFCFVFLKSKSSISLAFEPLWLEVSSISMKFCPHTAGVCYCFF